MRAAALRRACLASVFADRLVGDSCGVPETPVLSTGCTGAPSGDLKGVLKVVIAKRVGAKTVVAWEGGEVAAGACISAVVPCRRVGPVVLDGVCERVLEVEAADSIRLSGVN